MPDQETDQETAQETARPDQESVTGESITDQITKILNLIKSNPKITRAEMAKAIGLHDSSLKRRLQRLISESIVRRVGSTKTGRWEILSYNQ